MIAAAAAIEEALAALTAGTAETAAGARAAGMGLNDLDRASKSTAKSLGVDFIKALKEAIDKLDDLADQVIQLKGGAQKYQDQTNTLLTTSMIMQQALEGQWSATTKLTVGALLANDTLTKYARASLKQHDLLVKGYQRLSEFGAIDSSGLRGVLESAKRVGAVPETMDYMLETIMRNSQQLAMFGGTVSKGGEKLTKVVDGLLDPAEDFYRVLTNFGYTTEDIMKYSAGFIAVNSRTLKGMANDEAALKIQTSQYLETLTELSELTGVSRDQQLKAAEELQKEIQWRQYLRELAKEPDGAKKVQAANAIMAEQLEKQGRDAVKVMQDLIVNNGATSASSAQMQGVYADAVRTFKEAIRTGANAAETADKMSKQQATASNRYIDQYGKTAVLDAETARILGVTHKIYDNANYGMEDYLKTVQGVTTGIKNEGDDRLNSEAKRKQLEMAYANYYQELYFNVAKYSVPAMELFTKALIATAKLMNEAIPKEFKIDTREFDRIEKATKIQDVTNEQLEISKKQLENQEKIEKLDRTIAASKARAATGDRAAAFSINQYQEQKKKLEEERARLEKDLDVSKEKSSKLKAASTVSPVATANANTLLQGLRIKEGPEGAMRPGGNVLPETARAAQEFAKLFPNYTQFNAFDDKYHQGSRTSMHPTGRAFDVGVKEKPSDAVLKELKEKLKEFGVTNLKYEAKGEAGSTGSHIHIEVDPKQFTSKKVSMSLPDYKTMDQTQLAKSGTSPTAPVESRIGQDNTVLVTKLDDLHTLFGRSLRVQEEILTHTKMLA